MHRWASKVVLKHVFFVKWHEIFHSRMIFSYGECDRKMGTLIAECVGQCRQTVAKFTCYSRCMLPSFVVPFTWEMADIVVWTYVSIYAQSCLKMRIWDSAREGQEDVDRGKLCSEANYSEGQRDNSIVLCLGQRTFALYLVEPPHAAVFTNEFHQLVKQKSCMDISHWWQISSRMTGNQKSNGC